MRLEPGMTIKTNYSGPYRVESVDRRHPEHISICCSKPGERGGYSLNRWIESELRSVDKTYCGDENVLGYDTITVLSGGNAQMTLF